MRYYKYAHTHAHTKIFLFTLSTEREKMYELFHVGYLQIVSNFHPRSTLAKIQWIFGWNIYFYNLIPFHRLIDFHQLSGTYICVHMYLYIYMNHHISFTVDHRVHDWRKIFYPPIILCWACQVSGINYPIDLQKKGFMSLVEIWSKRPIWKKVFPLKVIFSLFFFQMRLWRSRTMPNKENEYLFC